MGLELNLAKFVSDFTLYLAHKWGVALATDANHIVSQPLRDIPNTINAARQGVFGLVDASVEGGRVNSAAAFAGARKAIDTLKP